MSVGLVRDDTKKKKKHSKLINQHCILLDKMPFSDIMQAFIIIMGK